MTQLIAFIFFGVGIVIFSVIRSASREMNEARQSVDRAQNGSRAPLNQEASYSWASETTKSIEESMPHIKILSASADCVRLNVDAVRKYLRIPLLEECETALLAFETGAINHAVLPFYNLDLLNKENRFKLLISVILYNDIKEGHISTENEWRATTIKYANSLSKRYAVFMQLGYNFDAELSSPSEDDTPTLALFKKMLDQINEQTHVLERDGSLVANKT